MINRFSRVPYEYTPYFGPSVAQEVMPNLAPVEQQLDQYQALYNQTKNYKLPEYIRESPSDTKAFNEYVNTLDGYKEKAINALTNKNLSEGINSLRLMQSYQERSQQPGGDFYELQKNAEQFNVADKELKDVFLSQKSDKYNPYMYAFGRQKLVSNLGEFKNELGNYRTGVQAPILAKYYTEKEEADFFDSFLDNITADQVAIGPYVSSLKGVPFKNLLQEGSIEKIDRNKVAAVLAQAITPQLADHYKQLGQAYGYEDDQSKLLPVYGKENDLQGFSSDTLLGRRLNALVDSKVYSKVKKDSKVVADSYNEALSLKEQENKMQTTTLEMGVFSSAGLPKWDIDVNQKGAVPKKGDYKYDFSGTSSPGGLPLKQNSTFVAFKDYIKTEEFRKKYPMASDLTKQYSKTIEGLSDKDAADFLKEKYEETSKKLQTDSYTFNAYTDAAQAKKQNTLLWGEPGSESLGMASNFTATVFRKGQAPEVIPVSKLVKNIYGEDIKSFRDRVFTGGEVTSTNPYINSGYQSSVVDKEGNVIKFVLSPKSLEDEQNKAQWKGFFSVLDPSVEESPLMYTGIPELDAQGPIKSKGVNYFTSDLMYQELESQKDNLTTKEYEENYRIISELRGTPRDKFEERRAIMVTEDGTPLMRSKTQPATVEDFAKEFDMRRVNN